MCSTVISRASNFRCTFYYSHPLSLLLVTTHYTSGGSQERTVHASLFFLPLYGFEARVDFVQTKSNIVCLKTDVDKYDILPQKLQ